MDTVVAFNAEVNKIRNLSILVVRLGDLNAYIYSMNAYVYIFVHGPVGSQFAGRYVKKKRFCSKYCFDEDRIKITSAQCRHLVL